MTKHKIIIADDHPLLVDGLRSIIADEPLLELSAVARTGKQLLQILPLHQPDLIILDINLPEIDGFEAAKIIKVSYPDVLVLCISTYYSKGLLDKLKKIPVNGFIPKQTDSKMVLQNIMKVLSGQQIFIKGNTDNAYQRDENVEISLLSKREKEVIGLIKKGLSTKEIAENLHLSIYTIYTHRKNICQKFNLTNPGSLIRYISDKEF
jgi:DNA-binding NarL/FixJ family response regulator